jgi:hypothetical protein
MRIRPVGTELSPAVGRTDVKELIVAFSSLASDPKIDGLIANSADSATVIYSESQESNPHPF